MLGELQLSVERGDQMLFSERNGSNPRPGCKNKISTIRYHYSTSLTEINIIPNTVVERLAPLLCIWDNLGSNLGPETVYPD